MGKKNKFRRNSGLRTVFKGTRQERESAGKKRAIEENMVEMDDRVAEWRQVSLVAPSGQEDRTTPMQGECSHGSLTSTVVPISQDNAAVRAKAKPSQPF